MQALNSYNSPKKNKDQVRYAGGSRPSISTDMVDVPLEKRSPIY